MEISEECYQDDCDNCNSCLCNCDCHSDDD